jgi:hypothetical protein
MRIARVRCFSQWQPFVHGPDVMSKGRVEHGFGAVRVGPTAEDGTVGWSEGAPIGSTYDDASSAG